MIINDAVLGRIASRWTKGGLFASKWANLVGQWCVDHMERYGRAPGRQVEALFHSWAAGNDREEEITLVERFLRSVSDEYDQGDKAVNSDFILDEAAEYFNEVKLRKLRDAIDGDIEARKIKQALARWDSFQPIEMGAGGWIDPFSDEEAIRRMHDHSGESLLEFKGGLKKFFGRTFARDSLVAILAPEKRGKSYWLLHFVFMALEQGYKVALFECGDLTQDQVMQRLYARAARRSFNAGKYLIPVKLGIEDGKLVVEQEEYEDDRDMTRAESQAAASRMVSRFGGAGSKFRLSVHANSSLSVGDARSILARWGRDGYTPDFVFFDYVDILAPMSGAAETRDQINMNWKQLSRMRQELHACVVTATQADAASYNADLLDMTNFSEDKRKYAHATAFFGLNQNSNEKTKGVYRLNMLNSRSEDFNRMKICYAAGCLSVANPCILSYFDG